MYTCLVVLYVAVVLWFILSFLQLGGSAGYNESVRRKRRILVSFLSVIVVGIILALMNPWFWLYLPLTFVVLGIALWILIIIEERSRWRK